MPVSFNAIGFPRRLIDRRDHVSRLQLHGCGGVPDIFLHFNPLLQQLMRSLVPKLRRMEAHFYVYSTTKNKGI